MYILRALRIVLLVWLFPLGVDMFVVGGQEVDLQCFTFCEKTEAADLITLT